MKLCRQNILINFAEFCNNYESFGILELSWKKCIFRRLK
ncbi:hypothetical protein AVDCRST_MAG84-3915 [uncultured Microcoleus sp.]|uniref:Uncharacterized protein n=1 Tax=uncultured Microcoleus sp. TaxID=259945 RepID=A0A6J4MU17_9CYAN|nr:hypothetical protein AVDCRST_MAG84-3915 [uncultured Microcoleus sp.]